MDTRYKHAIGVGVDRVSAWSNLLDKINVFPVADGDTGRNLVITLSLMRRTDWDIKRICHNLLFFARGNSGNIAARFFHDFIQADSPESLSEAIVRGRDQAWQAVSDPKPGTMLTFFDALADICREAPVEAHTAWVNPTMVRLEKAVLDTAEIQPVLKQARVIDAGALGMFLFFDGFFNALTGNIDALRPITSSFEDKLALSSFFQHELNSGFCVDAVVRNHEGLEQSFAELSSAEESVIVISDKDYVKVHLHTRDRDKTRNKIAVLGDILQWFDDDLEAQTSAFNGLLKKKPVHIMTDAAGSLTREDAHMLGITLLDSYIAIGGASLPETCFTPAEIYEAMRKGIPVSTSQASLNERHHHYQIALTLYPQILYLCVGSVFTGNYHAVLKWKEGHDPENRLIVLDTHAASGRLGVLAMAAARYAMKTDNPDDVIAFAGKTVHHCHEYIFIDKLHYLAAGGRLSKAGAFIGDMMDMKPVISPQADGAKKVGVVRSPDDQIRFALQKLEQSLKADSRAIIMLEYSDNSAWVEDRVAQEVGKRYSAAEVIIKPISLTTGVHTGPGTWAVAFVAERQNA